MNVRPNVILAVVEILGAVVECASAVLDGKPETKADLNRLFARIAAAVVLGKAK
jgi:hypothetical protein